MIIIVVLAVMGAWAMINHIFPYFTLLSSKNGALGQPAIAIDMPDTQEISRAGYGKVLSSTQASFPGAVIDRIELYVPECYQSTRTIIRYGKLIRNPHAKATILMCHGFLCEGRDMGFLRHALFEPSKYNIMTFDFRGHGESSQGQQCTFGKDEACDVITAAHFLKEYEPLKDNQLFVYGFSMGAVSAIEAQAKDPSLFKAMVLDCPFDSSEAIIKNSLESVRFSFFGYQFNVPAVSLLQRYAFHPYVQALIKAFLKSATTLDTRNIDVRMYPVNTAQAVQKVSVPCYFIFCKNDEKVSLDSIKTLFHDAASSYKLLWLTNGRRHFDSFFYNPEEYIKRVRSFLDVIVNHTGDTLPPVAHIEEDTEVLL